MLETPPRTKFIYYLKWVLFVLFTLINIADHPRSGVEYNFGRVCLSVCQTITVENLNAGSSFSHIRYITLKLFIVA